MLAVMDRFKPELEQIEPAARAAAKWWADRLRDGAGVGDNGGNDRGSILAGGLIGMLRATACPTPENCDKFETLLVTAICEALADETGCYRDVGAYYDGGPDLRMSVDYHPDRILRDALLAAGVGSQVISMAALPMKTRVFCSARRVTVSHGYAATHVEIYGPIYGLTRAEVDAAARYQYAQLTEYYAWRDALPSDERSDEGWPEWQGPLPANYLE